LHLDAAAATLQPAFNPSVALGLGEAALEPIRGIADPSEAAWRSGGAAIHQRVDGVDRQSRRRTHDVIEPRALADTELPATGDRMVTTGGSCSAMARAGSVLPGAQRWPAAPPRASSIVSSTRSTMSGLE